MRRSGKLQFFFLIFLCCWLFIIVFFLMPAPKSNLDPTIKVPEDEGVTGMRLAVLVPFRDRFYELSRFLPHMQDFLKRQGVQFEIFVLHQVDNYRFNRAALINAGFIQTSDSFDYVAIHDVDLLPANDNISYRYPLYGPMHLTPPHLHPKYHYKTFLGGILLLTKSQFELAGGMSNIFWGWGREDDEFRLRLLDKRLKIFVPDGITSGYKTFRHIHDPVQHPRDWGLTYNQRDLTYHRDLITGLKTLRFEVKRRYPLSIGSASATVLDIALHCDLDWTPYCQFSTKPKR